MSQKQCKYCFLMWLCLKMWEFVYSVLALDSVVCNMQCLTANCLSPANNTLSDPCTNKQYPTISF